MTKQSKPAIPRPDLDETEATPVDGPAPTDGKAVAETGGPKGLEPTRYGDWEKKGRCIDF